MRPLQATELKGSWSTLLLPIRSDETIDFPRLRAQLEFLVGAGVSGIYTNGTAGEFYTQTEDEFDRIQAMVANSCEQHGVPFQIGASHTNAQISLGRIYRTRELQPGAFQIILPDWFPLTLDEAVAFLSRMAEAAAPVGLILYNPPHAKRLLEPAEFAQLQASIPSLIGIKVAGGDRPWYRAMRELCPNLAIFVPGHELATGLQQGAAGSYSNVACLHPIGAQRWYELMQQDSAAALVLETRIQRFLARHIKPFIEESGYSNQAVDKLLATIGGWANISTRLRWPYRSIPEEEADRLRPTARALVSELLSISTSTD